MFGREFCTIQNWLWKKWYWGVLAWVTTSLYRLTWISHSPLAKYALTYARTYLLVLLYCVAFSSPRQQQQRQRQQQRRQQQKQQQIIIFFSTKSLRQRRKNQRGPILHFKAKKMGTLILKTLDKKDTTSNRPAFQTDAFGLRYVFLCLSWPPYKSTHSQKESLIHRHTRPALSPLRDSN